MLRYAALNSVHLARLYGEPKQLSATEVFFATQSGGIVSPLITPFGPDVDIDADVDGDLG